MTNVLPQSTGSGYGTCLDMRPIARYIKTDLTLSWIWDLYFKIHLVITAVELDMGPVSQIHLFISAIRLHMGPVSEDKFSPILP